jgi:RimJ/RimL family protein N-acetyltransferase/uncharacterized cupin superfamily protein
VALHFDPVVLPDHASAAVEFLVASDWPFHGSPRLTAEAAGSVTLVDDDVVSFWIREDDRPVGLIRAFDLDDVADGSPLFDVRIAATDRGRGLGVASVAWLTGHLFATYDELHRIEATTRGDNVAMQRVFARCGYRLEGRMVEAWTQDDGARFDSLTYAILRRDWRQRAATSSLRGPELFDTEPLRQRDGRPVGRVIVPPDADPHGPAFFEWELRAQEWSDEHPHDEWVYVLEGELHVVADGITVVAVPGALVRVPSGSRGTYRAPVFARMLSVYGPRPVNPGDTHGLLRDLDR